MEMRHLRYFVMLAEEANFRRAAERLGMAQPPLSRQIRALESEIGCCLVTRTPRGVRLTEAGRAFLEQARVTLTAAQRAVDRARVVAPESADRLVIGCEPVAGMAIVGRALAHVARDHPATTVELREQPPDEAVRAVRDGVTHAAVVAVGDSTRVDGLTVDRLVAVPLCLAVATGHPLAGPPPATWRRLGDVPFVLVAREAAPVLHDAIVASFDREGIAARMRHRAADLASALMLVAAGLGVTVLPSGWQPPRSFGIACRPLRPAVTIDFGIARRDAGGAAVRRFVQAVCALGSRTVRGARSRPRVPAAVS